MSQFVVTGAEGLIGRALVARLLSTGADVIAVDQVPLALECQSRVVDITEPDALLPDLQAGTTVFHLAALTSVAGSVHDPRRDFAVNVQGFLNVIESVRTRSARLVFTSTASVFDPRSPLPHAETSSKSPNSPYAAGKLAGEGYCAAYHKCYGLDVKVARLFNVYGPGIQQFAVYDFYRKVKAAETEIEILGDGSQIRDYVYLDDVVNALLLIAERGKPGEDYNVATGEPTTSMELAQSMLELMGRSALQIQTTAQTFPGDVKAWYADISKLRGLGFEPSVPLREGLRRTIDWLTAQGAGTFHPESTDA